MNSLQLYNVTIPQNPRRGDDVLLMCSFKLHENEALYSLIWYKDEHHQIFKYTRNKGVKYDNSVGVNIVVSFTLTFKFFYD